MKSPAEFLPASVYFAYNFPASPRTNFRFRRYLLPFLFTFLLISVTFRLSQWLTHNLPTTMDFRAAPVKQMNISALQTQQIN